MATQNPGFWLSRSAGTDITVPVTDESVIWDVTNTRFKFWNGTLWTPASGGLYDFASGNPAVDVINTTGQTNVYSTTIPGGMLGTKGILRATFFGDVFNNTGSPQVMRFLVQWAGNSMADTGGSAISFATAGGRYAILGYTILAASGAANAQHSTTRISASGTATNISMNAITNDLIAAAPATSDSTVAQTFVIQAQPGLASNSLEYRHWATWVEFIAGP